MKVSRKGDVITVQFEAHKPPIFKEQQGKDWVMYGDQAPWKNAYGDYLIYLNNRSSKHNAIVGGKVKYIYGKGFNVRSQGLKVESLAVLLNDIKKTNGDGDTLNKVAKKAIYDLELFGGIALKITWARNGRIADIAHVDFSKIRKNKAGTKFYYTENWVKNGHMNYRPELEEDWKVYDAYNEDSKKGTQLFYFMEYRPGMGIYPLPEYVGASAYIECDAEIANFHLNNTKFGFTAGTMVNFNDGEPTNEEKASIENRLKGKHAGTDNAGGIVITFNANKDVAPEVLQLRPNDMDKQYDVLNKTTQQEIFTGHKITSGMLFGVKSEGQLGGRTEIIEAYELLQKTYAGDKQAVIEEIFNGFYQNNGYDGRLYLERLDPISVVFSEQILSQYLPIEEFKKLVAASVGIKYKPAETITPQENPTEKQQLSKHKKDFSAFSKYGMPETDYEVIQSNSVAFLSDSQAKESEEKMKFSKLTDQELKVLDLLKKDGKISMPDLSKAASLTLDETLDIVDSLAEGDYIKIKPRNQEITLTEKANTAVENYNPKTEILVVYKYDWADGFNNSDKKTSRDFCKELLSLKKLYSREDIQNISNAVGYDVWTMRGGFYTIPGTETSLPYCRHVWKQQVVKRK